jgi:hypothetical protein
MRTKHVYSRCFLAPTLALVLCCAGICSAQTNGRSASTTENALELVVQRVLEKQYFRNASEVPICLGDRVRGVNLSSLVKKLSAIDNRIRGCEGVTVTPSNPPQIHVAAVQIHIRSVETDGSGHLIVHAGYWCGVLCADDTEYKLVRVGAGWKIIHGQFIGNS